MKNDTPKNPKKDLEKNITDKFMAAIDELGHDSLKLKREIKKAAKFVTKKIDRKIKAAKEQSSTKKAALKALNGEKVLTSTEAKKVAVKTPKAPAAKKATTDEVEKQTFPTVIDVNPPVDGADKKTRRTSKPKAE